MKQSNHKHRKTYMIESCPKNQKSKSIDFRSLNINNYNSNPNMKSNNSQFYPNYNNVNNSNNYNYPSNLRFDKNIEPNYSNFPKYSLNRYRSDVNDNIDNYNNPNENALFYQSGDDSKFNSINSNFYRDNNKKDKFTPSIDYYIKDLENENNKLTSLLENNRNKNRSKYGYDNDLKNKSGNKIGNNYDNNNNNDNTYENFYNNYRRNYNSDNNDENIDDNNKKNNNDNLNNLKDENEKLRKILSEKAKKNKNGKLFNDNDDENNNYNSSNNNINNYSNNNNEEEYNNLRNESDFYRKNNNNDKNRKNTKHNKSQSNIKSYYNTNTKTIIKDISRHSSTKNNHNNENDLNYDNDDKNNNHGKKGKRKSSNENNDEDYYENEEYEENESFNNNNKKSKHKKGNYYDKNDMETKRLKEEMEQLKQRLKDLEDEKNKKKSNDLKNLIYENEKLKSKIKDLEDDNNRANQYEDEEMKNLLDANEKLKAMLDNYEKNKNKKNGDKEIKNLKNENDKLLNQLLYALENYNNNNNNDDNDENNLQNLINQQNQLRNLGGLLQNLENDKINNNKNKKDQDMLIAKCYNLLEKLSNDINKNASEKKRDPNKDLSIKQSQVLSIPAANTDTEDSLLELKLKRPIMDSKRSNADIKNDNSDIFKRANDRKKTAIPKRKMSENKDNESDDGFPKRTASFELKKRGPVNASVRKRFSMMPTMDIKKILVDYRNGYFLLKKDKKLEKEREKKNVFKKVKIIASLENMKDPNLVYKLHSSISDDINKDKTQFKDATCYPVENNKFSPEYECDYYFERKQVFECILLKNKTQIGKYEVELGNIIRNKDRAYRIPITENRKKIGTLIIGLSFDTSYHDDTVSKKCTLGVDCNIPKNGRKDDQLNVYYILSSKDKDAWKEVYKCLNVNVPLDEEKIINDFKIDKIDLLNGNKDNKEIKIDLYNANDDSKIGEGHFLYETALNYFKEKKEGYPVELRSSKGKEGTILIRLRESNKMTFADFLNENYEINLLVAIDFTKSNKVPTDKNSLHFMTDKEPSDYEKAFLILGDIIANYDFDQKFPVYGFGGIPKGTKKLSHCFNVNGKDKPEVNGLEGIKKAYRKSLKEVKLFGPTYFHEVIDKVRTDIEIEYKNPVKKYYVLIILTDGVIEDMKKTIESIFLCEKKPLSIVIIGIGTADFTKMKILDGDKEVLTNSNGEKIKRDLVQFVEFNNFKHKLKSENGVKDLRNEVLYEIPRQITNYLDLNDIAND